MNGNAQHIDENNMETLAVSRGKDEVNRVYTSAYEEGDIIILEIEEGNHFVWLQWDDALGESLVYLTGNVTYRIPFASKRINLSPKAFSGKKHLLRARIARDYEIVNYRNLSQNVCDQHNIENIYPHAIANVETRNESVFAAQNAIDGVTVSNCHGEWPYESWGINRQEDAKIRIEFGREVLVDRVVIYLRTDFPHDNWWEQVTLRFSDGSEERCTLRKLEGPQEMVFKQKEVSWIEMCEMKKSDDSSPFPALTQIQVFGNEKTI